MQDASSQGPITRLSLWTAFVELRAAALAYRQIPEPCPLVAVGELQRIVERRFDAKVAFAAALDRRGVPQGTAQRIAWWLAERMTPSERAEPPVRRAASEGRSSLDEARRVLARDESDGR